MLGDVSSLHVVFMYCHENALNSEDNMIANESKVIQMNQLDATMIY